MAKIVEVQEVAVAVLKPYERNAKIHSGEQVQKIAESIKEFGFLSPCLIDREKNIIAGHGRVEAAKLLGLETVPCVFIEGLSDEQRRAYILADNKLTELGEWDFDVVKAELLALDDLDFDVTLTGFELPRELSDWFQTRERNDDGYQEGNDEYNEFLKKFEQAKTTDDCYTPDIVYDAVADWVTEQYGYSRDKMIRPFYPNGDYQKENYPEGCVVVDNPPFSILSEIRNWYKEHKIKYFLFAPSLSCIGGNSVNDCAVATNVGVTYENKAVVSTSFVTNLEPDYVLITAPEFAQKVQTAADEYAQRFRNPMPKYSYPIYVITAAMAGYLSKYGQDLKIPRKDALLIRELDMQKEQGKAIYGGGYLLSEKAAAEKAAAEKAAAEKAAAEKAAAEKAAATVWELSDREKELIKSLGEAVLIDE